MAEIVPLSTNGPGWRLTVSPGSTNEREYTLWAPRSMEYHEAHKRQERSWSETHPTRSVWQAEWSADKGYLGDGRRGDTLEEVLTVFPEQIARMFRRAVEKAGISL